MGRAYDTISPLFVSEFKPEPIDLAMMKDGERLTSINPTMVRTTGGKEVRLNLSKYPVEKSRFKELVGQTRPSNYANPPKAAVKDIEVVDGDTFWAIDPNGNRIKYRLADVDTPELKAKKAEDREKAASARDALQRVLASANVTVQPIGLGPNGETVAKVSIDGDISKITGGPSSQNVGDALIRLNLLKKDQSAPRAA